MSLELDNQPHQRVWGETRNSIRIKQKNAPKLAQVNGKNIFLSPEFLSGKGEIL